MITLITYDITEPKRLVKLHKFLKEFGFNTQKSVFECDIDDEAVWGINDKREADRKLIESRRFGESQVLRYLERLKQEPKSEFTSDTE